MGFDQNSEGEKGKKEEERNYGCPCGKTYLSYPALFTHVKQKHEGKAPGPLIKPKTEKTRGRPRLNSINNDSEAESSVFQFYEELSRVLSDHSALPGQFNFQITNGKATCNDMMSQFLNAYQFTSHQKNILHPFFCLVRDFVKEKNGQQYWNQQHPSEIIDLANEITKSLPTYKQNCKLQKKLVVDLVYILFKWMYKNKWTDHKLIRRYSDSTTTTS